MDIINNQIDSQFIKNIIEDGLSHTLENAPGLTTSAEIAEAISYSFYPAGKRIRPLLLLSFGLDLGVDAAVLLPFALAIEILHTASLIHDDLPALDNDKERRGRACLHILQGAGVATLVGDYLTSLAFHLAGQSTGDPEQRILASKCLAEAYCKLSLGQIMDINNKGEGAEDKLSMYDLKTGALFSACIEIPRLFAPVVFSPADCENFARLIGRAFQIENDLKDSGGHLQRSRASNQENQRKTLGSEVGEGTAQNAFTEHLSALKTAFTTLQHATLSPLVHLRAALHSVWALSGLHLDEG